MQEQNTAFQIPGNKMQGTMNFIGCLVTEQCVGHPENITIIWYIFAHYL
jgi:hypothetical protein